MQNASATADASLPESTAETLPDRYHAPYQRRLTDLGGGNASKLSDCAFGGGQGGGHGGGHGGPEARDVVSQES